MSLFAVIIWLVFAIAVGNAATRRYGRSGFGWFVLSVLISPLLGFLLLVIIGGKPVPVDNRAGMDWRKVDWSGKSNVVPIAPPAAAPDPSFWIKLAVGLFAGLVLVAIVGTVLVAAH